MTTQTIQEPQVTTDVTRHKQRVAARDITQKTIVRIFLITMSLLFLVPLYWMLSTALKPATELSAFPPNFWPANAQWGNFADAIGRIPFWSYFWNTLVITVLSVVGAVLANLIVAYGFACINWPGRDVVFYLIIATLFLPTPITLIPLFDLFAHLQWIDTMLPLVVPHFFASAFFVFMLRQFLLQIPRDLLEASRIDGASELQILGRVVFPMALPAITVVAIFTAIGAWNDFMGPLIYLQDDTKRTLSIGLQVFRSTHDIQFNLLMAASLLVVLPVVILFLVFQRFFIKGVTVGAIR